MPVWGSVADVAAGFCRGRRGSGPSHDIGRQPALCDGARRERASEEPRSRLACVGQGVLCVLRAPIAPEGGSQGLCIVVATRTDCGRFGSRASAHSPFSSTHQFYASLDEGLNGLLARAKDFTLARQLETRLHLTYGALRPLFRGGLRHRRSRGRLRGPAPGHAHAATASPPPRLSATFKRPRPAPTMAKHPRRAPTMAGPRPHHARSRLRPRHTVTHRPRDERDTLGRTHFRIRRRIVHLR